MNQLSHRYLAGRRARLARLCGSRRRGRSRRGLVLILVLVVVSLLTVAGLAFTARMFAERRASDQLGRQIQAQAVADSGLAYAREFLALLPDYQLDEGGNYQNPLRFQGVLVTDGGHPSTRGRFSIVAPALADDVYNGVRFGVEDESNRVNLNVMMWLEQQQPGGARELLMALPGMTEEVADAILDWIDEDDEPREYGAELDEYSSLTPPYAPKNGPLDTIEELLLVRGVTPELLFGSDMNRNLMVDSSEVGLAEMTGVDNSDGAFDRGWSAYLTLWSAEANVTAEGEPRIYINGEDLETLYDELDEALGTEWATFIVAYRQNGPYTGNQQARSASTGAIDFSQSSRMNFQSTLDLIGAKVEVTFQGANESTVIASPLPEVTPTGLAEVFDVLSVNESSIIPGRININQAPRPILLGIPTMTEEIVDAILAQREPDPAIEQSTERRHETWLLAEGLVTLDDMKLLIPFVNAGGSVYRAQVVGYFEEAGGAARAEAVIDATTSPPRQLFWRDMTHLGRGFPLELLGLGAAN